MNITMTTDEIVSLLNVSSGTFRNISSKGKVGERLLAIGYELIHQYKDGKFNVYEIRKLDNVTWSEIQAKHNIKDSNKNIHSKYSITRLKSMDKSRKQVISDSDTNIAYTTAKRYDDILLQEKVMKIIGNKTIKTTTINAKNVVYRMFDNNGSIIYIGKSNELRNRIYSHSMEEKEDDWFDSQVTKIEYISFKEYGDCSIAEMYFITKLKPKYNKDFVNWNTSINIQQLDELKWNDALLNVEPIQVYDKGEKYEEFIKMLGVDK